MEPGEGSFRIHTYYLPDLVMFDHNGNFDLMDSKKQKNLN